jgi:hypothetical protein
LRIGEFLPGDVVVFYNPGAPDPWEQEATIYVGSQKYAAYGLKDEVESEDSIRAALNLAPGSEKRARIPRGESELYHRAPKLRD